MGEHKGGVLSSLVPIGDDPMGEDKVKSSFHTSSDICKCIGFPLRWIIPHGCVSYPYQHFFAAMLPMHKIYHLDNNLQLIT